VINALDSIPVLEVYDRITGGFDWHENYIFFRGDMSRKGYKSLCSFMNPVDAKIVAGYYNNPEDIDADPEFTNHIKLMHSHVIYDKLIPKGSIYHLGVGFRDEIGKLGLTKYVFYK